jgi:hypothetical protein
MSEAACARDGDTVLFMTKSIAVVIAVDAIARSAAVIV